MKEIKSFLTESNSNSKPTVLNEGLWEAIERDNYQVYDAFVDFIKDFYAPDDNKKAYEIEDVVNGLMLNMFKELDSKYGKNITESRTETDDYVKESEQMTKKELFDYVSDKWVKLRKSDPVARKHLKHNFPDLYFGQFFPKADMDEKTQIRNM